MAKRQPNSGGCLGVLLRFCIFFTSIAGIALLILGPVIENPPRQPVPIVITAVGVLTLLASLVGFMGSFYNRTCLFFYILLLLFFSLLPLGAVTLLLYIQPEEVTKHFDQDEQQQIKKNLKWFRWIGLIICGIEILSLLVAWLQQYCCLPAPDYQDLEAQHQKRGNTRQELAALQDSVAANKEAKPDSQYRAVHKRIADKYGKYAHGEDWGSGEQRKGFWGKGK